MTNDAAWQMIVAGWRRFVRCWPWWGSGGACGGRLGRGPRPFPTTRKTWRGPRCSRTRRPSRSRRTLRWDPAPPVLLPQPPPAAKASRPARRSYDRSCEVRQPGKGRLSARLQVDPAQARGRRDARSGRESVRRLGTRPADLERDRPRTWIRCVAGAAESEGPPHRAAAPQDRVRRAARRHLGEGRGASRRRPLEAARIQLALPQEDAARDAAQGLDRPDRVRLDRREEQRGPRASRRHGKRTARQRKVGDGRADPRRGRVPPPVPGRGVRGRRTR